MKKALPPCGRAFLLDVPDWLELLQLSEVLDGANHLAGVAVLVVVPSNNLYEGVAVADLADHGLVSVACLPWSG